MRRKESKSCKRKIAHIIMRLQTSANIVNGIQMQYGRK